MDRPHGAPSPAELLEAAVTYARRGWRVIPNQYVLADGKCSCDSWRAEKGLEACGTPGKHPRFRKYAEIASTEERRIQAWWKDCPLANVGVISGKQSGLLVLDEDPRNGGDWTRDALVRRYGALLQLASCVTGGGGTHGHYVWPADLDTTQSVVEIGDGLEVLLEGHNVVMPPSFAHLGGQAYFWDGDVTEIPPAPSWLVDLVRAKLAPAAMAGKQKGAGNWPAADIGGVLRGCGWMRHCSDHAASLSEPEWYAQLSIVGRCENGEQLAHELSRPHPKYRSAETTAKLRRAIGDAGPVTCAKVRFSLGGERFCKECPNAGAIKSPIVLGIPGRQSTGGRSSEPPPDRGAENGGAAAALSTAAHDSGGSGGDLPRIDVKDRHLRQASADALKALQCANDPPVLFARMGQMVAVLRDEKRRLVIYPVSEAALRGRLDRSANYFRGGARCYPPVDLVRDIQSLPPADWVFPPIDGVVESPILRPSGSILDSPGYDADTRLYYAPDPDLKVPLIAESPHSDHVDVALALLDRVLADFPFLDGSSRSNTLAAFLTPIVKPAIDAPAPMAVIDAPQAGTGKSLLADLISIVCTGRPGEMFSAPREDDEWRKQLTMALSSGTAVVVIDNVNRRLDNGDLCKVLTETLHVDRAFRTHEKIVLPVKASFIATGNNIQLSGDMPRRCYWIRLDAKMSQPFMRTGFKIGDLKAWTIEHRGELLAALLTLARAWYSAGRPKPRITPLGSYETWSTVVGGILQYAGVEGFLANASRLYEEADSESIQWEGFLQTLSEVFYGEPFTVSQIFEKLGRRDLEAAMHSGDLRAALPDYLAEATNRDGFFQRRTGRAFAERSGRRFGSSQVYLERAAITHKVQEWRVVAPTADGGLANPLNPQKSESFGGLSETAIRQ